MVRRRACFSMYSMYYCTSYVYTWLALVLYMLIYIYIYTLPYVDMIIYLLSHCMKVTAL